MQNHLDRNRNKWQKNILVDMRPDGCQSLNCTLVQALNTTAVGDVAMPVGVLTIPAPPATPLSFNIEQERFSRAEEAERNWFTATRPTSLIK